jgi:hypothetical protein
MSKNEFRVFLAKMMGAKSELAVYTIGAQWLAKNRPALFDIASELAENSLTHTIKYRDGFVTTCWHTMKGEIPAWEASRYPKAAKTVHFALKVWDSIN